MNRLPLDQLRAVVPSLHAERAELLRLVATHPGRGFAAALALCVPALGLRGLLAGRAPAVGAALVWEALYGAGYSDRELEDAARPILHQVRQADDAARGALTRPAHHPMAQASAEASAPAAPPAQAPAPSARPGPAGSPGPARPGAAGSPGSPSPVPRPAPAPAPSRWLEPSEQDLLRDFQPPADCSPRSLPILRRRHVARRRAWIVVSELRDELGPGIERLAGHLHPRELLKGFRPGPEATAGSEALRLAIRAHALQRLRGLIAEARSEASAGEE